MLLEGLIMILLGLLCVNFCVLISADELDYEIKMMIGGSKNELNVKVLSGLEIVERKQHIRCLIEYISLYISNTSKEIYSKTNRFKLGGLISLRI